MSISTIQARVAAAGYASVEEVVGELELMFANALEYNQPDSGIAQTAGQLLQELRELVPGSGSNMRDTAAKRVRLG